MKSFKRMFKSKIQVGLPGARFLLTWALLLSVVLLSSLFSTSISLAQDGAEDTTPFCATPTGENIRAIVLRLQIQDACYGGNRDSSELTLWFSQQLTAAEIPDSGDLQESHLLALEIIIQRLSNTVRSHAIEFESANRPGAQVLRAVADHLASESPSQTTGSVPSRTMDDDDGNWRVDLEEDMYGPDINNRPLMLPLSDLLEPNCQPRTNTDNCSVATETLSDLIRVANLMRSVNQRADRSLGINLLAYQHAVIKWDLYTNEARVQYPWEMWVNGHFYQKGINKRKQAQGRDVRLVERLPPSHQIILLHPGVGLEYVNKATDGSRLEPAVIMEWVGYNSWSYRGRGVDVSMARPLGVSLVTTWSDRNGSKNIGHGLALHWNHNLTTGLTWRNGGEAGLFISIGLAERFSSEKDRLGKVKDLFGALRP